MTTTTTTPILEGEMARRYKGWNSTDDALLIRFKVDGDEQLSWEAIAEATGRSVSSVKSRWQNVLKKNHPDV